MPTITVRLFDYETLRARLNRDDRIVILSCGACARQSDGLGGQAGMDTLADKLTADGFTVVGRQLLGIACSAGQWADRLQDKAIRELMERADVLIPLSCQAGSGRAAGMLPNVRILRVTRTLGKGTYSPEKGARLTEPVEDVDLQIDDAEGISIPEAARRLGLHPGSF